MEFPGELKKQNAETPGVSKKEVEFPGVIKKKIAWNFYGSWCLALEIPMGVTRFGGIARGETSFCLEVPRVE